jgi:hypothetical protein|tara:strand:+ start:1703 stop:1864 length:162 start_codon:yes stop_codon:yes gene_type:complete
MRTEKLKASGSPVFRILGIEDSLVTGLQAVHRADHGPVDDDPHTEIGLIHAGH